ncbi:DNA glycosylase [Gloeophyllum trabeum ATCC 11539]|uniref:DNA glycosylase n=1 Tax=Gloeophyllum trabeum (strain ATCC 11539 / FP-39264 / Madison 617) TaxID=670483 RepID=S7RQA8_GLOTA|nr:DNA glycosylase [Gloeophyllum trabeum ATCC 11539]EPQ56775.1 DNA glycosylase [Gloeophyllum trabeum ATCC 11539]
MSAPTTPKKSRIPAPYFSPSRTSRYFSCSDVPTKPRNQARTVHVVLAEVDSDLVGVSDQQLGDSQTELVRDPAFLCFGDLFIQTYDELWRSKPILIQEHLSGDPWTLLIATTFLNKTAGKYAIPIFWEVLKKWPTPEALSAANESELVELITPLGLQRQRAKRIIKLSNAYLKDPPLPGVLHRSKVAGASTAACSGASEDSWSLPATRYPPTPISHLPGAGPYALDSYRIFCARDDEWKSVRPSDKELIKYLKWKWAVTSFDLWEPESGVLRKIALEEMQALIAELAAAHGCHGLLDRV